MKIEYSLSLTILTLVLAIGLEQLNPLVLAQTPLDINEVEVAPAGQVTSISGNVLLQGRTDHSGTKIFLSDRLCASAVAGEATAVTDVKGHFEITPANEQQFLCLQAVQPGYLMGQKEMLQGNLGSLTLPGGDVDGDGSINILDLAFMAINYSSANPTADVNDDDIVDIFDLTIAASNYNQLGPVINWE